MDILAFVVQYEYWFLFLGLFCLGETVLLPAIYFSLEGKLNIWWVITIATLANIISDIIWYEIAKRVPFHRVKHWHRVERHQETFKKLMHQFDKHHLKILFISKFVYGTRILVQIICGVKRVHFWRYLSVNFLGIAAYTALLYAVALAVNKTLAERLIGNAKVAILVFIVIAIGINLCIKYYAEKKLLR
jgi:membrane protein DedA with SNARE-associated domain